MWLKLQISGHGCLLFDFFMYFVPCTFAIHALLTSKEDTTLYLLNFPLANYHLETGNIEQTLTSMSMRSNPSTRNLSKIEIK